MEIASITYKTELTEILNNDTVEDIITPLMTKVNRACQNRDGLLWNNMTNGGLSDKILVDGSPKYHDEAIQCSYGYKDVVDQMTSLVGTSLAFTSEREILELKTLRQKLFDRNSEIQGNIATLNSNYENRTKGDEQQENTEYEKYYGANGSVTLSKNELAENERKIYEVNARLSKVNGGSQAYTKSSDTDKRKITIQNARGAPDSEWKEVSVGNMPNNDGSLKKYEYTTADGVKVTKIVKDGHVVCYHADDGLGDDGRFYFDSAGNQLSSNEYLSLDMLSNFTVGDDYKKNSLWTNDSGNYSYNKSKENCATVIATGSNGEPLYYVVHDGNKTTYYSTTYEKLSAGQVEKIVKANNLTPVNIPASTGTGGGTDSTEEPPPTEPTCDPTDPSTEPSTTEPSTVPPEESTVPPEESTVPPEESTDQPFMAPGKTTKTSSGHASPDF